MLSIDLVNLSRTPLVGICSQKSRALKCGPPLNKHLLYNPIRGCNIVCHGRPFYSGRLQQNSECEHILQRQSVGLSVIRGSISPACVAWMTETARSDAACAASASNSTVSARKWQVSAFSAVNSA